MKVNQEKMAALYGHNSDSYSEAKVVYLIKSRIEWLMRHGKDRYSAAQWVMIQDINDMLDALEEESC